MSAIGIGRNLTVIARNRIDGFYYPGYITRNRVNIPNYGRNNKAVYHVKFQSIAHQNVPHHHVIVVGGATPWPDLKTGNYVLAVVKSKISSAEYYVPGIVVAEPMSASLEHRFFTIRLHNGNKIHRLRSCIIKIGPERYAAILDYIASLRYRRTLARNREKLLQWMMKQPKPHPEQPGQPSIQVPHTVPNVRPHRHKRRPSTYSVARGRHYKCSNPDCEQTINCPTNSSGSTGTSSGSSIHTTISSTMSIPIPTPHTDPKTPTPPHSEVSTATSRRSLHRARPRLIKKDTVVLAKWLDDGWFYFGRIATVPDVDEELYTVVDDNDHREMINREDIFTEEEQMFEAVQPHDRVVGLHPGYVYSYAPGTVTEVYDQGVLVAFFDGAERRLPRSEVYKISSDKYHEYVKYIHEKLNKMCGDVVARDDKTGKYRQYKAVFTDVKTQQIELKEPDTNTKLKQLAIHVFPIDSSTRHNEQSWRYVIAPIDNTRTTYIPAKVTNIEPFKLAYCDGTKNDEVTLSQCFYINKEYYKNATRYLLNQSLLGFKSKQK